MSQFPTKVTVSASTMPELIYQLQQQLGTQQGFIILYMDPEFHTLTQLSNIAHLPRSAEITLHFTH